MSTLAPRLQRAATVAALLLGPLAAAPAWANGSASSNIERIPDFCAGGSTAVTDTPLPGGGFVSDRLYISPQGCRLNGLGAGQPGFALASASVMAPPRGDPFTQTVAIVTASASWSESVQVRAVPGQTPSSLGSVTFFFQVLPSFEVIPTADPNNSSLSSGSYFVSAPGLTAGGNFSIDHAGNSTVEGLWGSPIESSVTLRLQPGQDSFSYSISAGARSGVAFRSGVAGGYTGADISWAGVRTYVMRDTAGNVIPSTEPVASFFTLIGVTSGFDYLTPATPIPEPGTWALMAAGLLAIGWRAQARQRRGVH